MTGLTDEEVAQYNCQLSRIYMSALATRSDNAYNARLAMKHRIDELTRMVDRLISPGVQVIGGQGPDDGAQPGTSTQNDGQGQVVVAPEELPDGCEDELFQDYEQLKICFSCPAFVKKLHMDIRRYDFTNVINHILDTYIPELK